MGENSFWKTRVDLGKKHNQEFVQIPHATFLEMLTYKAEAKSIRVIVTEESYTSKASFLDLDSLPTYDPALGVEQRKSLGSRAVEMAVGIVSKAALLSTPT